MFFLQWENVQETLVLSQAQVQRRVRHGVSYTYVSRLKCCGRVYAAGAGEKPAGKNGVRTASPCVGRCWGKLGFRCVLGRFEGGG